MKIKILLLSTCIALCCSCDKEEPVGQHAKTITLQAVIGEQTEVKTRAKTDDTGTRIAFTNGDKLGLYATGPLRKNTDRLEVVENLEFEMKNNKWEDATAKLKWDDPNKQDGSNNNIYPHSYADIYAYHPYQADLTSGYKIFDNDNKVLQDILMAERTTVQHNNPAIFLTFKHRFSLIQLSLGTGLGAVTENDVVTAIMDKSISNTALIDDQGIIQLQSKSVDEGGITEFQPLQPLKKGTTYYIVIPCEKFGENREDSIQFTHVRIGNADPFKLSTSIIPQPNTKYNLKVHKGEEGSVTVEMGDIELWGNNHDVGSIREEAGLYWASDVVNMINAYNTFVNTKDQSEKEKAAKTLERFATWNEAEGYWEIALMRSIDMKDVPNRGPIIKAFTGIFDGRGNTITGLDINGPGLFGIIKSGSEVKDLTLKDIAVSGTGTNTGALAGVVEEGTTIHNCKVEGTSTVVGNGNTSGLIGSCDGKVTRSASSADVINGTGANTGGLIGHLGENGSLKDCQAISNVTSEGNNVGGLVGYSEGTINNSYAACKVKGVDHVGGLVGQATASIENCYTVGSVEGGAYVGGLAGYTTSTIRQSVTDGTVKGSNVVGGMAGYSNSIVEESSTRALVSGTNNVGGFIGEFTNIDEANTYIKNCYAINQLPLTGNKTEVLITYSYEIGSVTKDPEEVEEDQNNGYFYIPLDADTETINDILAKLKQNESSAQWELGKIIIGDKVYSLPVLINK